MKAKLFGIVLFFIFLLIWGYIYFSVNKFIFSQESLFYHVDSTEFTETVKYYVDIIKKNGARKLEENRKNKVWFKIFFVMLLPEKKIGFYFNGKEYVLKENEVKDGIKVLKIDKEYAIIEYDEHKYRVYK